MHVLNLRTHVLQSPAASHLPSRLQISREQTGHSFIYKYKRIILWVLFGVLAVEVIASSFLIHTFFFSPITSYAVTHANYIKPGPATDQLLSDLQSAGLHPQLLQKIKRPPFSGDGSLVSMNGDNIQIFEYADAATALKEASILQQTYATKPQTHPWDGTMHLYIRDTLVIFYMGTQQNILSALQHTASQSLALSVTTGIRSSK